MSNPYRPDPNRTHTEAVQAIAEAIWRVDGARPSRFPFSDLGDACAYRAMAEVAIEAYTAALGGLTEELRYPTSWTHPHPGPDRRLVTPWVAVPDSGGQ